MVVTSMRTEDLRYRYGKTVILDGIDIEVRAGEVLGILGPNGCGKTTTLRNLNRNLSPDGGCVLLDGTDLEEMTKKDIARKVAVVPQTNEVQFAFSVRDIVSMGRMPFQGMMEGESAEDERIIDEAIARTGLEGFRERTVDTMSGGERQRVVIARAIAQTPDILLMDEPTLHLDISMQFETLDLVRGLCDEDGLTVVIVSHDLPMAARYCDRLVLIRDHRVYASGTPEEVLTPDNMRMVFGVDAELSTDGKNGKPTVLLHGSCREEK